MPRPEGWLPAVYPMGRINKKDPWLRVFHYELEFVLRPIFR
ncbi:hypothetical protein KNP414_02237 [Paenibacillus mucilaginosus KNP414]|uniref:Uncharacterized protein n=1 Tax=Paenibacillus mucilaginosus (strain KNP414) TaxID=1036673 RepID=F8F568_PAEMK|nr:hypothetical protein KNP414_02237 [Paenibacillus mucilaginosus KNP414]